MPRIAVVVPATGSIASLEASLVSVLQNRPEDCEVLVVLNQRYEDPYQLAGEASFVQAGEHADLLTCINLGVQTARAPIVHVLAVGHEVSEGWTAAAIRHFDDPAVGSVAPLVESPEGEIAGIGYRAGGSRYVIDRSSAAKRPDAVRAPGLGAGFYRKAALEAVGGFTSAVGEDFADIDTGLALRRAGYTNVSEPASRVRMGANPRTRSKVRAAYYAERLFWRNAPNVGWASAIALHPWVVAGAVLRNLLSLSLLVQLLARVVALCHWSHYRAHHKRLKGLVKTAHIMPLNQGSKQLRLDSSHIAASTRQQDPRRAKAS